MRIIRIMMLLPFYPEIILISNHTFDFLSIQEQILINKVREKGKEHIYPGFSCLVFLPFVFEL